jgi:Dolichyl-phosphate-mannose-protein mannosyltransferase
LKRQSLFENAEALFKWALALGCLVSLMRVAWWVAQPFQLSFGEGPLLGVAARVAHGLSCYPDPRPLPYMINPYGPVGYYLLAGAVKLLGVSFTIPRMVIVASAICCGVFIALLLRRWTGSTLVGAMFGSLYLTMPVVLQWIIILRVDLIGVAFTLAGLYFFATSKQWFISVPFFVGAFFCKFTFVAAPGACFVYMLSAKEWQKALKFAGSCLALGTIAFLASERWTGGWFTFDTVWASAVHPFRLRHFVDPMLGELTDNLVPLLLTIVLCFRRHSRKDFSLPLIYLVFAFIASISRGKLGADSNYFLEWEAALCICLGFEYSLLRDEQPKSSMVNAMVPLMLACSILATTLWTTFHKDPILRASVAGCKDAYQFVKEHRKDRILSENVGALVLADASPVVYEAFLWTREVLGADWSADEILDLIRSRRLPLILLTDRVEQVRADPLQAWLPRPVAEAIGENYSLFKTFDCADIRYVYEPQPLPKP